MVSLSEIAKALNLDPKEVKQDFSTYGKVISINADKTYQVSLNGSDVTVKCARLTGAKVGDIVLVTVLKNGYAVVTGCVGGDRDAADTAQYFWYQDGTGSEAGAHITEIPREDFEDTPAGGNILMRSNSIKIRNAATVLAELTASGMTVYQNGGICAQFGARTKIGGPSTNHLEIFDNGITGVEADLYNGNVYKCGILFSYLNGDYTVQPDSLSNTVFDITTDDVLASTSISGDSHTYGTITVTYSGGPADKFYPIGIIGWNSPDTSQFVPSRLRLSARAAGSATIAYDIRNVSGSSATGKITSDILWLKIKA